MPKNWKSPKGKLGQKVGRWASAALDKTAAVTSKIGLVPRSKRVKRAEEAGTRHDDIFVDAQRNPSFTEYKKGKSIPREVPMSSQRWADNYNLSYDNAHASIKRVRKRDLLQDYLATGKKKTVEWSPRSDDYRVMRKNKKAFGGNISRAKARYETLKD